MRDVTFRSAEEGSDDPRLLKYRELKGRPIRPAGEVNSRALSTLSSISLSGLCGFARAAAAKFKAGTIDKLGELDSSTPGFFECFSRDLELFTQLLGR